MILRSNNLGTSLLRRPRRGGHIPLQTTIRQFSSDSPSPQSLPPPVKPSLSDFLPPASIPDPTLLEPLSTLFLSLPPSLSLSYATFIPLLTIFYRSLTTLPVVLWQRKRTRRFTELVIPRLKKQQMELALKTRDECRRLGKSYQEYQTTFKKRAKTLAYSLAKEFNCSPRLTLILPPLIHIPIFITATLTLRDACTRALSTLSLTSTDLPIEESSYLTQTGLNHLQELSSTSFLWCPSLILPDPTMFLPLGVGIISLLNVELSAKNRLNQTEKAESTLNQTPNTTTSEEVTMVRSSMSASEKRRMVARKARDGEIVKVRGYSTRSTTTPSNPVDPSSSSTQVEVGGTKLNTAKIVTNILRFASVAFIPVAGLAPSAVCLYWIASNLFTLVQNGVFRVMDSKREKEKRMGMILQGKVSARGLGKLQ
ncbi:hypothetical protein JCM3765_007593 [Sporobolomyces pararoseus]